MAMITSTTKPEERQEQDYDKEAVLFDIWIALAEEDTRRTVTENLTTCYKWSKGRWNLGGQTVLVK